MRPGRFGNGGGREAWIHISTARTDSGSEEWSTGWRCGLVCRSVESRRAAATWRTEDSRHPCVPTHFGIPACARILRLLACQDGREALRSPL